MTIRPCETCGREKPDGRRECVTCRVRRARANPEKRERDREASRRWKDANRERNQARDRAYYRRKRTPVSSDPTARNTLENQSDPATVGAARGHGNQEGTS